MLTLHKISGGRAGAYAEYLTSIEATGDYYVGPDGDPWAAPGEWLGGLAEEWGLAGLAVDRAALLAVLEGRDPRTGEQVVRVWRADRVAAHDLVFSAPSSVTAVWAVAGEELRAAIQQAQDQAVAEAFAYIEANFALVRRRDPGQRGIMARSIPAPIISEPAAALLGAAFQHHTARQTAAQAKVGVPPDPQLHTHVLVPGVAKRRDGALVAINSLVLHQRRAEAGAVYRAALAARLGELGFAIERQTGKGGHYFELSGIPVELREVWSSRHQEIEGAAAKWRREFRASAGRDPTVAEERDWAAKSRASKGRFYRGDLFTFWRDTAAYYGITPETVEGLRHRSDLPAEQGRAQLIAELLGSEGVTREHATFDVVTLRREAYERAPGLVAAPRDVEEALGELVRDKDVIELKAGVWTTREIIGLEKEVLAWRDARACPRVDEAVAAWRRGHTPPPQGAEKGSPGQPAAPRPPAPSPRAVEEALLRCPVRLSDEQGKALTHLLTHPFTALTGEAGTGKGVVLRVAADVWRSQKRRIFAVAVGGAQAQRLAADLGRGVEALTLDAFIWRVEHDRLRLTPYDVVALDEAGQVDTRRWAAFARAVGDLPTVVALGDHAQLSPIGAGGLWPLLARGGPKLTEVRRTTLPWEREAWAHLRRGQSGKALELYARHRGLDISATRSEALEAAVAAWDHDGRDGLIVVVASNHERYRANRAAQDLRRARGELGADGVSAMTAQGEVTFHAGDPVLFMGRYQRPGMERRVENGTTAEVIAVDPGTQRVRVRTHEASPRELEMVVGETKATAAGATPPCGLDLYYASHVVKSQGATVRRSYVLAGGWQTDREGLYVAVSRSREGTRLFVDRESLGHDADVDALAELVRRGSQSRAKTAAVRKLLPRSHRGRTRQVRQRPQGTVRRPRHRPSELSWHVQGQLNGVAMSLHRELVEASAGSGSPPPPERKGGVALGD